MYIDVNLIAGIEEKIRHQQYWQKFVGGANKFILMTTTMIIMNFIQHCLTMMIAQRAAMNPKYTYVQSYSFVFLLQL